MLFERTKRQPVVGQTVLVYGLSRAPIGRPAVITECWPGHHQVNARIHTALTTSLDEWSLERHCIPVYEPMTDAERWTMTHLGEWAEWPAEEPKHA